MPTRLPDASRASDVYKAFSDFVNNDAVISRQGVRRTLIMYRDNLYAFGVTTFNPSTTRSKVGQFRRAPKRFLDHLPYGTPTLIPLRGADRVGNYRQAVAIAWVEKVPTNELTEWRYNQTAH
jgi:hypothetical protein